MKRLFAVETLGSTTVICTDKTGTLTLNRMRVVETWGDEDALARIAASCTTAELDADGERLSGDPTEVALLAYARARGVDVHASTRDRHRRALHGFDSALRLMTTVDQDAEGLVASTKGAPERVLSRCELDAPARAAALARAETFAAQGLRVLALARRRLPASCDDRDEVEKGLELVGLVALLDPPRAEVANAGEQCHRAGIRVLVVTGDHGLTALEVARRVGLDVGDDDVFGADEVERMTDAALDRLLAEQRELVFARAAPETKLRIADLLRRRGETVAMTGDGVNDARALRRADIGIAMGRRRHGRRAGGGNDGAHRRQLREYRLRGRGRQARLREHPEVRLLHLRARHPGGRPIPRLRPVGRAHPPCR